MNENEAVKIQNLYNFTNRSKIINEFELVREVARICFRVRVLGTKSTKVYYYEEIGKSTHFVVEDLSMRHKAIIVIVMIIMGKDMKNVSRLFFEGGFGTAASILREMQINYEIPRSIREFREEYIRTYCDTKK